MEKATRKRTARTKRVYPEIDPALLARVPAGAYIPPNLTEWHDIDAEEFQEDPYRYRINGRPVTNAERVLISIRHGLGHVCSDELALAIYSEIDGPKS